MSRHLTRLGALLIRLRIGNIAVAAAMLLLPVVLAAGFLTDRERLPGHGISARAGMQAALETPAKHG